MFPFSGWERASVRYPARYDAERRNEVILPNLESVWWFGLLLLVVIFTAAFVNNGPPRYAYTGFQAGICFLLTVAQGYHQSFSIVPALDRVVGIMIGALLGAAVLRLIWPPSPRGEFCRGLEHLFGLFHARNCVA